MDSSMRNSHLFGDAKASAVAGTGNRKQQALIDAKQRLDAEPTAENSRRYGTALFELGNFAEAEQVFAQTIAKHGEEVQVLVDLGFTYKNLNRIEDAKKCFLRAVELAPKTTLARCAENEVWMLDPSYQPSWIRRNT